VPPLASVVPGRRRSAAILEDVPAEALGMLHYMAVPGRIMDSPTGSSPSGTPSVDRDGVDDEGGGAVHVHRTEPGHGGAGIAEGPQLSP
jgi:hypothetical protein